MKLTKKLMRRAIAPWIEEAMLDKNRDKVIYSDPKKKGKKKK